MYCTTRVFAATLAAVLLAAACEHEHARWTSGCPAGSGCVVGSGILASETRAVADFDGVVVDGPIVAQLRADGAATLELTAEDNLLAHVRSEVRGGRLHLYLDGVSITSTRGFRVRVGASDLREIEANAAARLEVDGLHADELTTRLSGASSVRLSGLARSHLLWLSGASRCQASELRSEDAVAAVSGASYALVNVSRWLRVEASGASTLEYIGDPRLVSSVSGESVVRRVGQ